MTHRQTPVWQILPHAFYLRAPSGDPTLPFGGELYGWARRVRRHGEATYWLVHWRFRGARLDQRAATPQKAAQLLRLMTQVEKL